MGRNDYYSGSRLGSSQIFTDVRAAALLGGLVFVGSDEGGEAGEGTAVGIPGGCEACGRRAVFVEGEASV